MWLCKRDLARRGEGAGSIGSRRSCGLHSDRMLPAIAPPPCHNMYHHRRHHQPTQLQHAPALTNHMPSFVPPGVGVSLDEGRGGGRGDRWQRVLLTHSSLLPPTPPTPQPCQSMQNTHHHHHQQQQQQHPTDCTHPSVPLQVVSDNAATATTTITT